MRRLIRKANIYSNLKFKGQEYKIYINPTEEEINQCKNFEHSLLYPNSIRGVIIDEKSVYCWQGDLIHKIMVNLVDCSQFRFFVNEQKWIFDAHKSYVLDDYVKLINEYQDILSKFGDLKLPMQIFFLSDVEDDKISSDFNGIKEIEEYVKNLEEQEELMNDNNNDLLEEE